MTTFDEREKAFEKKFVLDEELRFKTKMRRNRLFAHWAAEKMGMSASETEDYARAIIKSDLEAHDDTKLTHKVMIDFAAKNVTQSEHQVQSVLADLFASAARQVRAESAKAP